jgi:catechol O-methyltransferase
MIPFTINRKNVLQWLLFGLKELYRIVLAVVLRAPSRELEVTRTVERLANIGDPKSVLEVMDQFAQERRFLMNVGIEKGMVLRQAVTIHGASRALELGAYCGYSAVLLGAELKKVGGTLVSLEASPTNAAMARRVVGHAGLEDVVDIRVGTAAEGIELLKGRFDLIFIDHLKDEYLSDLKRIEDAGLLEDGALVIADNVGIFSGTLCDYLEYVRSSPNYQSTHHALPMEYNDAIQDGIEVSIWTQPAQCATA